MHRALRWHRAGFAEARALDSWWLYGGGSIAQDPTDRRRWSTGSPD